MSGLTYIGVMLLVLFAFNLVILKPYGKEDKETNFD